MTVNVQGGWSLYTATLIVAVNWQRLRVDVLRYPCEFLIVRRQSWLVYIGRLNTFIRMSHQLLVTRLCFVDALLFICQMTFFWPNLRGRILRAMLDLHGGVVRRN